jgi:hypothetical protein
MALTDKLTAIGDAIREQTGSSELMTLDAMPAAIRGISGGGGSVEVEPIELTGDQQYGCAGALAGKYIELFGDTITTKNITNTNYMFKGCTVAPSFDINMNSSYSADMSYMFNNYKGTSIPMIHKAKPSKMEYIFSGCHYITSFPDGLGDDWDWSYLDGITSPYSGQANYMFSNCYSLRSLPMSLLSRGNPVAHYSYTVFNQMCRMCYALDEIIDLPNPHKGEYYTTESYQSIFGNIVADCYRLKNFTFAEMGPTKWAGQTLDFSSYTGWSNSSGNYITDYSAYHGITADKEVKDDATYQALKDDPDWFTKYIHYSRYNHDSAVRTINSLPDCSAYTAEKGVTNTIKFKGDAGSATDGGAIRTLTEAEIAVATAKGWTVEFV